MKGTKLATLFPIFGKFFPGRECFAGLARPFPFKNALARVLEYTNRFFIGYWILKTGLDFYPGLFFFSKPRPGLLIMTAINAASCLQTSDF